MGQTGAVTLRGEHPGSEGIRLTPDAPRRFPRAWFLIFLPLVLGVTFALLARDTTIRYEFMMREEGGTPVRWNACEPIGYVVNPDGAPPDAVDDVERAFRDIADVGGFTFVDEGRTEERPAEQRAAYQPDRYGERWAPILIAWVAEDDPDVALEPRHYGRAGPSTLTSPEGERVHVSGQVVISAGRFDRGGLRHHTTLLHEIGHVLGLGHVDDPREIMHPSASMRATELGPGDRAGLERLGPAGGCVTTPSPGPTR